MILTSQRQEEVKRAKGEQTKTWLAAVKAQAEQREVSRCIVRNSVAVHFPLAMFVVHKSSSTAKSDFRSLPCLSTTRSTASMNALAAGRKHASSPITIEYGVYFHIAHCKLSSGMSSVPFPHCLLSTLRQGSRHSLTRTSAVRRLPAAHSHESVGRIVILFAVHYVHAPAHPSLA